MSNANVGAVYEHIIDEVINTVRVDFEEGGVGEDILEELKKVSALSHFPVIITSLLPQPGARPLPPSDSFFFFSCFSLSAKWDERGFFTIDASFLQQRSKCWCSGVDCRGCVSGAGWQFGRRRGGEQQFLGGWAGQPLFGSLFKLQEGLLKGPLIPFPAIRLADAALTSRGPLLVNPKSRDSVSACSAWTWAVGSHPPTAKC